ncbi:hypothetical protein Q8A67_023909 [Cirrhinus molitorella]|uniref:Uncharacterized protein n=1 Tax=Cirrhinus molitorella TaxID=172907 RepID=A0AA88P5M3_9TELE|nr:hypothetical protein Q8A67_023909 [Cirrhinus molitorella]
MNVILCTGCSLEEVTWKIFPKSLDLLQECARDQKTRDLKKRRQRWGGVDRRIRFRRQTNTQRFAASPLTLHRMLLQHRARCSGGVWTLRHVVTALLLCDVERPVKIRSNT